MTSSTMDVAEFQKLLEADWLEDEYKTILKDAIRRSIKLIPVMIDQLEESLKDD